MERELEAVNRFAKTVLTEEHVYIFSVRLCDCLLYTSPSPRD